MFPECNRGWAAYGTTEAAAAAAVVAYRTADNAHLSAVAIATLLTAHADAADAANRAYYALRAHLRTHDGEQAPAGSQSQAEIDATITLPDGTKAVPVEHHRECHHKLVAAEAELARLRAAMPPATHKCPRPIEWPEQPKDGTMRLPTCTVCGTLFIPVVGRGWHKIVQLEIPKWIPDPPKDTLWDEPPSDVVRSPQHYHLPDVRQAWEVIEEELGIRAAIDYHRGAEMKYQLRAGRKTGATEAQDLAKAAAHRSRILDLQIAMQDGTPAPRPPMPKEAR